MSTVYFDSPASGIELAPRNARDILAGLCDQTARGILNVPGSYERLCGLISTNQQWAHLGQPGGRPSLDQLFAALPWDRGAFAWKGRPLDMGEVAGNTALRAGPDAVKLAARLHGHCEVHCWCEGGDRRWLAGIISEGRRPGGPLASGPGSLIRWEPVKEFLCSRDDEPVVLSWSNGGEFPDDYYAEAGWEPPSDGDPADAWLDLPDEDRWRIAMRILRDRRPGLRIEPGTWNDFAFGHGLSAVDILAADYADRLDQALLGA